MKNPQSGIENHPDGTGNLNAIINGDWAVINEWFNVASGLTASQSGTTVTASASVFIADMVGAVIRYANGVTAVITAYTSGTGVTVSPSQSVSSQAFEIYRTDQSLREAIARALMKRVRFNAADQGLFPSWNDTLGNFEFNFGRNYALGTLTYASTKDLDFNSNSIQTVSLTGNITFTTSNRGAGKCKTVRIVSDGSTRNFTFPSWTFVGATAPASIAASKTAILHLYCFGTNDTDIVAHYIVQP